MTVLIATQAAALTPEVLLLTDGEGRDLGRIEVPALPQARNARLRWHGDDLARGSVMLDCLGQRSVVEFEYLSRELPARVRFTLLVAGQTAATAELQGQRVEFSAPVSGVLLRTGRFLRSRFELRGADGAVLGRIEEPSLLSATRRLRAELPSTLPLPVQAFVLFLANNQIHRQV